MEPDKETAPVNSAPTRRRVLGAAAIAPVVAAVAASPALARTLTPTPPQTEGPFYPDRFPVDIDANLLQVAGRRPYTKGTPALVRGRVVDRRGRPMAGLKVEIWQCDAAGRYHHTGDGGRADPDFQGYGHTTSAADGGFAFRTIRPAPYPGRTPHIHVKVSRSGGRGGGRGDGRGGELLTTQLYIDGHPLNQRDFLLRQLSAAGQRSVMAPYRRVGRDRTLVADYQIVLDWPEDV